MVLWNFDLLWKTMVLWTNLWFYTGNYGTLINEVKNGRLPKTLIYNGKKLRLYTKTSFWKNFDLLWQNYGTTEKIWYYGKKIWYYEQNKDILKTENIQLWLTMEKLCYYGKNYGTIVMYNRFLVGMFCWFVVGKICLHPINKDLFRNHYCFLPHSFSLLELGVKDQNIKR